MKRAYMMGHKNAKFSLRGQDYEYSFNRMAQINKHTRKERQIRPPKGSTAPKKPLLPTGPMIIVTVKPGQPGSMTTVSDPNNPGQTLQVFVPAHAKPGQRMAIPVPAKGESVQAVQAKQKAHDKENGTKGQGWTTGGAVAAGGLAVAGVAGVAVGGVILGDHLAGGDLAETIGAEVADAAEAVGDGIVDAADAVADWAPDAFEDAGEWLGEAGEDIGDFVMDLF